MKFKEWFKKSDIDGFALGALAIFFALSTGIAIIDRSIVTAANIFVVITTAVSIIVVIRWIRYKNGK